MNDPASPRRRSPLPWLIFLALVVLAALAAGFGWRTWQSRLAEQQLAEDTRLQRWTAIEQNLEALRRDQRAANLRLQDAAATNRILRDEMLGLSQRGALLEETVERLADPDRHGAQALRLDEVELLLSQGQQRLSIAGDLDGARRAYALAAGVLQGIDDPTYLNLRQSLVQERNALDALGPGPRHVLGQELDAFISRLQRLPQHVQEESDAARPWWQRALSPLVQIRPSRGTLIAGSERRAAQDALQIELTLARAALERGDAQAFAQALRRVDAGLLRLWPDSPALRAQRTALVALGKAPLRPDLPELGTTLRQLQAMREGRQSP
ncbi:MAG TPA: uroporphyrinogen-III C-methyltransferase [Stenotrophomonas sp.]|nr:uroporphyrinogen-III C-methyltransferase [Stenotrophomonas sp.]